MAVVNCVDLHINAGSLECLLDSAVPTAGALPRNAVGFATVHKEHFGLGADRALQFGQLLFARPIREAAQFVGDLGSKDVRKIVAVRGWDFNRLDAVLEVRPDAW